MSKASIVADFRVSEDLVNEDHFFAIILNGDMDANREAVVVGDMWNKYGVGIRCNNNRRFRAQYLVFMMENPNTGNKLEDGR